MAGALDTIPFLSGYMTMDAANRARESQDFQRAGQFMTLQGAIEDRGAKRAALERDNAFRARLATATTDAERAQIAMEAAGPTGVLTHLDKVSRDRATAETARARLTESAARFNETRRLRQAEIDRLTNNDQKREAQQVLNNEARAFELQLKAEAARLSGAIGADTVMGFQPRPVPAVPTMQTPSVPASATGGPVNVGNAVVDPEVLANPEIAAAVAKINAGGRPQTIEVETALPRPVPAPSPAAAIVAPQATGSAWAPPAPVVSAAPAAPNNLDARDLGAQSRPVPTPGQGVPGVRAAQSTPMPQFVGSPREVRKLQNDWLKDVAEADRKQASKDGKIGVNLAGGRESVFINRVVNSGNQAVADLENVVRLPISASRGIFGGRQQGKSLFEAGKETLANTMTTQEVQTYNVVATGFQRALAAIEGMGLAPSNALMHQMDGVIFKEGDTNMTKLTKLAQIRQIVEKGLETVIANQRVDAETKKLAQSIVEKAVKAVPFTPGQVIELQALQNVDPNVSLKDVMAMAKEQQPGAAPWSPQKEQRYQELLRKQSGRP